MVMPRKSLNIDDVREVAGMLPDIEISTARGVTSLKFRGKLLACPATHQSAEPNSLVVKIGFDDRAALISADPDVYYVTEHYVNYPSILVRLSRLHFDALRDLLVMACRSSSNAARRSPRKTKTPARTRR